MTKFNFIQTEHYKFLFDNRIRVALMLFCSDAENRWGLIHKILNINASCNYQDIVYSVLYNPSLKTHGKARLNCITCILNHNVLLRPYMVPFIHEESHVIIRNKWYNIPAFWNEALAEYVLISLCSNNRASLNGALLTSLINTIAKIINNSRDYTDLKWTLDNQIFLSKCRTGESGYLVAAYLVEMIIQQYGIEFLHKLLDLINANDIVSFKSIIVNEGIAFKWMKYLNDKLSKIQNNIYKNNIYRGSNCV